MYVRPNPESRRPDCQGSSDKCLDCQLCSWLTAVRCQPECCSVSSSCGSSHDPLHHRKHVLRTAGGLHNTWNSWAKGLVKLQNYSPPRLLLPTLHGHWKSTFRLMMLQCPRSDQSDVAAPALQVCTQQPYVAASNSAVVFAWAHSADSTSCINLCSMGLHKATLPTTMPLQ